MESTNEETKDESAHKRTENVRIIKSTGKDIVTDQAEPKIGFDIKFEKSPQYLDERVKIWEELYEQQEKKLADMPREPITITLIDGEQVEGVSFETSPMDISGPLASRVITASVKYKSRVGTLDSKLSIVEEHEDEVEEGWSPWDIGRPLEGDCEVKLHTFEDPEGKAAFWHSSAHILGQCLEVEFGVHL